MGKYTRSADADQRRNELDEALRLPISGEFLGSNGPERLKKCRQLAAEAAALAANAINPETRKTYLDLERQWLQLAAEMERVAAVEHANRGERDGKGINKHREGAPDAGSF